MNNLTDRQLDILRQLNRGKVVSSEVLANKLHVSSRTIRNDIHKLNEMHPNCIISIPSVGFELKDLDFVQEILDSENFGNQSNNIEFEILKEILSKAQVNIADLSEKVFLSDTALLKIIKKINKSLVEGNFNLSITRKNNHLFLVGQEEEKRKVISYFLTHEFNSHTLNINDYQNFFSQSIDLNRLKGVTVQFFESNNIDIRDIELISFILHVSIMIDRVKQHHSIVYENYGNIESYYTELAKEYTQKIQKIVFFEMSDEEINYLASLFAGKINLNGNKDVKNLSILIDLMLKDVNEIYGIDFQTDERLKRNLLTHLVGLENRIKYKTFLNNPMLEDIKRRFPILFDISVYIANQIQEYFHVRLYEEEISYLTLHLMGSLERTSDRTMKQVVIVSPVGFSGIQFFKKRLSNIHQYTVVIKAVLSLHELDKIDIYHPDLVISFDDKVKIDKYPIFYVNHLLNDDEIEQIYFKLNQSYNKIGCMNFFDEKLFFSDMFFESKEECIHFLCEKLEKNKDADSKFEQLVLEREKVAPTAYGNFFAMPHPIKKEGLSNRVVICVLNKAIDWNSKKVKIVFLICLNKNSHEQDDGFDELFDRISSLLDDFEKAKSLTHASDYNGFLDIFFDKSR